MKSKYVELGDMYALEGKYEEAYREYLEAAIGEKDSDAMERLARMYLDEKYMSIDFKKAFRYLTMACEAGLEPYKLMEVRVLNTTKIHDDEVGSREYRKFLEHIYDEEVGYLNIWLADEHLDGVFGTDIDKFIELCEKGANAGASVGYDLLGELYFKGEYVKQDYEKAYKYFTMNDDESSDAKLFYLGEMYRCGLYVKKDTEKAKYYCNRLINFLTRTENSDYTETWFYDLARVQLKKIKECNEEVI